MKFVVLDLVTVRFEEWIPTIAGMTASQSQSFSLLRALRALRGEYLTQPPFPVGVLQIRPLPHAPTHHHYKRSDAIRVALHSAARPP